MKISIVSGSKEYCFNSDKEIFISNAIAELDLDFSKPCGGNGKCGKCFVMAKGKLSEPTEQEKMLLGGKYNLGFRLACMTRATGDCRVEIPTASDFSGVTAFGDIAKSEPMTGENVCHACVFDIGTTTIAAYLYKMPEFVLEKFVLHKNEQVKFGADVVSRITYAEQNGVEALSSTIKNQLEKIISELGESPDFSVLTGNTSMLYFLTGQDVSCLAKAPFHADELFGRNYGRAYLPRCISAFVGADITCGIISSGMLSDKKSVLIDIGTNGEIVYKNHDSFTCCSAAAGPAFEGSGIVHGMPSVNGAINKVYNLGNRFEYTTIADCKPCGICGSGLIDLIASMLKAEVLDKSGYLEADFYIGDSGICITPNDIRAVQTAKAAIRAALETICDDFGSIDRFYISGSFGSFLNIENAIYIGLLPKEIRSKFVLCGNTAAAGAAMMLADKNKISLAEEIAEKTQTVQLASNEIFYEKYIEYMSF